MTVYNCDSTATPPTQGRRGPSRKKFCVLGDLGDLGGENAPVPNPEHNSSDAPQIDPWDAGYYNVSDNPAR